MKRYRVRLTNVATGETTELAIEASHPATAQCEALARQFHENGWNRCTAAVPIAVDAMRCPCLSAPRMPREIAIP